MREYREASRESHPDDTVFYVGPIPVGGPPIAMMVGPCAVESREQLMAAARAVRDAGFPILRGGAYKPRTSPYSFQGMHDQGLELLDEVRRELGLRVVTEVMSESDVEKVAAHADMLQIGSRSMHCQRLLEAVADAGKPILLKRGFHATIAEWLLAAEYILRRGNRQVAKRETHLPVIVDPSQGTGRADLVIPMAKAAIAAGADGLLIETHPNPAAALSDSAQQIPTTELGRLRDEVALMARAMGRPLAESRDALLV